jgi:hypothetical protein
MSYENLRFITKRRFFYGLGLQLWLRSPSFYDILADRPRITLLEASLLADVQVPAAAVNIAAESLNPADLSIALAAAASTAAEARVFPAAVQTVR